MPYVMMSGNKQYPFIEGEANVYLHLMKNDI